MPTDPNFAGSIFEQVGLTAELCDHCGSHLAKGGVCLNGCTLSIHSMRTLQDGLRHAQAVVDADPAGVDAYLARSAADQERSDRGETEDAEQAVLDEQGVRADLEDHLRHTMRGENESA